MPTATATHGAMSSPVVSIHTNEQQMLSAIASAHSFRRQSRHPERFEVRMLRPGGHAAPVPPRWTALPAHLQDGHLASGDCATLAS
jgi:hypothetical protein